jgi:hypothetical protein
MDISAAGCTVQPRPMYEASTIEGPLRNAALSDGDGTMIGSQMLQNADIEVSVHPSLRLDVYVEPIMTDSTQLANFQQHYNISHTGRRVQTKAFGPLTLVP